MHQLDAHALCRLAAPPTPPRKRLLCAKLTTYFSSLPGLPEQDFSGALVGPVVGTAALSALVLMFLCKR